MGAQPLKCGKASSAKRQLILQAASQLFLGQGYAATSMDAVSASAGVSKATLYAHFKSKQALFESIVQERFRSEMEQNLQISQLGDEPMEGLTRVAMRFLSLLYAPTAMGTMRVVLAESARLPELGEAFYRSGPARTLGLVTSYMEHLNRLSRLKIEDPALAADLFLSMLRNANYLKCLLGLAPGLAAPEIERLSRAAASLFIAACSPPSPKN